MGLLLGMSNGYGWSDLFVVYLDRAIELFEEERGYRLSTFAGRLIQQHITAAMASSATIFAMSSSSLYRSMKVKGE